MTRVNVQTLEETGITGDVWVRDVASAQGGAYQPVSGAGAVTSVSGSPPISSTGGANPVISLNDTAVTPGSYTNTSLTVDQKGRLTAASSGVVPVTSVTAEAPFLSSSGGTTPLISFDEGLLFSVVSLRA